jgi:hypothetical protein
MIQASNHIIFFLIVLSQKQKLKLCIVLQFAGSPCSDPNNPAAILAAEPGELLKTIPPDAQPAAQPPAPLQAANVVDPPLPPVISLAKPETPAAPTPPAPSSGARAYGFNSFNTLVSVLVVAMLYAGHH